MYDYGQVIVPLSLDLIIANNSYEELKSFSKYSKIVLTVLHVLFDPHNNSIV
jgi:hypothetical protein